MYKTLGTFLSILSVMFMGINHASADTYTFPDWVTMQANVNWFGAGEAAKGYTSSATFLDAIVVAVNNDPAHIAAGLFATRTSDGFICANGVTVSAVKPTASYAAAVTPPVPDPPCYQNYTKYNVSPWSACSISDNWSSAGTASCIQKRTVSAYSVSAVCGTDSDQSAPSDTQDGTLSIDFTSPSNSCGNAYANGSDTCTVAFSINGPSEGITGIDGLRFQNTAFSKATPVNQVDKTGANGLLVPASGTISGNKISLNLSSIVPFTEAGKMTVSLEWGGNPKTFTDITSPSNLTLAFKKPYIGLLQIEGGASLKVGTEQSLQLNIVPKASLSASSYTINRFADTLAPMDTTDFLIQNKNSETGLSGNPTVNFTLNYKGSTKVGKTFLRDDPQIHYSLGGSDITYYLSKTDTPSDRYTDTDESEFIGVRVVGQIQGQGKQVITGQVKNFSDVSLLEIRSAVKKNVAEMTRGMKSGDIVNGVKYVEGDATISGDQPYELLVVHNGNVIISGDVNASGKKFGIVATRDDQSRSDIGNVYVKSSVSKIQAYVYADGGFLSANASGVPYTQNTAARTNALSGQLILKGLLLTRNTIGGAIGDNNTYLLPESVKTSDLDKAIMYDLNYVRRNYAGWDKNGNTTVDDGEYKDAFVIIYDEAIRNNPPEVFLVK